MSEINEVISVAVVNEEGEHFKETVVEHLPGIDSLPAGTELVDRAHVTRMQAEIERLRRDAKNDLIAYKAVIEKQDEIRAERDQLKAEVEALRKDAERYRWLRDLATSQDIRYPLMGKPDEIDATVDAARSK